MSFGRGPLLLSPGFYPWSPKPFPTNGFYGYRPQKTQPFFWTLLGQTKYCSIDKQTNKYKSVQACGKTQNKNVAYKRDKNQKFLGTYLRGLLDFRSFEHFVGLHRIWADRCAAAAALRLLLRQHGNVPGGGGAQSALPKCTHMSCTGERKGQSNRREREEEERTTFKAREGRKDDDEQS